ncbi:hypothetical protein FQN60_007632 [Etheostoma spectabile]|uniref:MAM domain-containing protein n=1 Tax=Etheostoma spectabile TaxID=54343 RepID=A0A5J5CYQ4_9PERO|nr:hypothetical protein FQN60_007632 [Etheostoma spectabile]
MVQRRQRPAPIFQERKKAFEMFDDEQFIKRYTGCTFDEDSDPGLCEYRQGQDDDFDWQLIRTYNWPHPTPDLLQGPAPLRQAGYVKELPGFGGV